MRAFWIGLLALLTLLAPAWSASVPPPLTASSIVSAMRPSGAASFWSIQNDRTARCPTRADDSAHGYYPAGSATQGTYSLGAVWVCASGVYVNVAGNTGAAAWQLQAPQLPLDVPSYGVTAATISAGGSGYTASATGTVTLANGTVLNVTTNSSGVVTTVNSVTTAGSWGCTVPSGAYAVLSSTGLGSGTGATFTVTVPRFIAGGVAALTQCLSTFSITNAIDVTAVVPGVAATTTSIPFSGGVASQSAIQSACSATPTTCYVTKLYDQGGTANHWSTPQTAAELAQLGGTVTTGNVLTVAVTAPGLNGGSQVSVTYTVQSTDTTQDILGASLVSAINGNSTLSAANFLAIYGGSGGVLVGYPGQYSATWAISGGASTTLTGSANAGLAPQIYTSVQNQGLYPIVFPGQPYATGSVPANARILRNATYAWAANNELLFFAGAPLLSRTNANLFEDNTSSYGAAFSAVNGGMLNFLGATGNCGQTGSYPGTSVVADTTPQVLMMWSSGGSIACADANVAVSKSQTLASTSHTGMLIGAQQAIAGTASQKDMLALIFAGNTSTSSVPVTTLAQRQSMYASLYALFHLVPQGNVAVYVDGDSTLPGRGSLTGLSQPKLIQRLLPKGAHIFNGALSGASLSNPQANTGILERFPTSGPALAYRSTYDQFIVVNDAFANNIRCTSSCPTWTDSVSLINPPELKQAIQAYVTATTSLGSNAAATWVVPPLQCDMVNNVGYAGELTNWTTVTQWLETSGTTAITGGGAGLIAVSDFFGDPVTGGAVTSLGGPPYVPPTQQAVTLSGTPAAGSKSLVITASAITGSPVTVTYTDPGTTLAASAAALTTAINATTAATVAGYSATSSGAIITLTYPAADSTTLSSSMSSPSAAISTPNTQVPFCSTTYAADGNGATAGQHPTDLTQAFEAAILAQSLLNIMQ